MITEEPFRTIVEPFRIHSVEPMRLPTRAERASALQAAGYNLFELAAEDVPIDLLPYGRQEEWQDSPEGWPQSPTYSRWASSEDIAALYGSEGM